MLPDKFGLAFCFGLYLFFVIFGLMSRQDIMVILRHLTETGKRKQGKPRLIRPYSFSTELSGSFTCPVNSTDTWDLGFKVSSEGPGLAGDRTRKH